MLYRDEVRELVGTRNRKLIQSRIDEVKANEGELAAEDLKFFINQQLQRERAEAAAIQAKANQFQVKRNL